MDGGSGICSPQDSRPTISSCTAPIPGAVVSGAQAFAEHIQMCRNFSQLLTDIAAARRAGQQMRIQPEQQRFQTSEWFEELYSRCWQLCARLRTRWGAVVLTACRCGHPPRRSWWHRSNSEEAGATRRSGPTAQHSFNAGCRPALPTRAAIQTATQAQAETTQGKW